MSKKIRFGIIGAGRIAQKFARGIAYVEDAQLTAIASRNIENADDFANMFAIEKSYGSYQELAEDPDVDIIYISTPNSLHKDHTLLCLRNKKAVICEKPFAANRSEVEEMIQLAKENNVFLMEAMWTRFLPVVKAVKQWVEEGLIGEIKMLEGDFGFKSETGYGDIRFNKALAGGSLMDVGIYPLSFASMIYKTQPIDVKVIADLGKTGVDEQAAVILGYENGSLGLLSCGMIAETPKNMYIIGEKGYIHIPDVWYAQKATLKVKGKDDLVIDIPMEGNGYNYEVEEVVTCIQNGKLESDIMPLSESLEIIETLDRIKAQI